MKKNLFMLSLISLVGLTSLSSCSGGGVKLKDGVILTVDGKEYTVDDLYGSYNGNIEGAKAYYDVVSDALVRVVEKATEDINVIVDSKIDDFKQKAKDDATTNGTTYNDELEKALKAEKMKTLEDLKNKYFLDEQKKRNEKAYYDNKTYIDTLTPEFIRDFAPYHVRHILVKVGAGSNEFYNSHITEENAKNIASVVKRLSSGKESFGEVAVTASEDTGSAKIYGDAGIMHTGTGFVSEFKLGTYVYDTLMNTQSDKEKAKVLKVPSAPEAVATLSDVKAIPYSKVLELEKYADKIKDENKNPVKDSTEQNYPRNILFNQYFNHHGLSFIVKDDKAPSDLPESRFKTLAELKLNAIGDLTATDKVLVDEKNQPILVTRAGTGSGDSGYQGIHFIVLERSPLMNVDKLSNYYDVTIPPTSGTDDEMAKYKDRYITFIKTDTRATYEQRSNTIKDSVKAVDANFQMKIYESNLAAAKKKNVTINSEVEKLIDSYISVTRSNAKFSADESFETSWKKYLQLLVRESDERGRILPEGCIDAFNQGNVKEATVGGVKGVCYVER